jgi:hypothetical protein
MARKLEGKIAVVTGGTRWLASLPKEKGRARTTADAHHQRGQGRQPHRV